MGVIGDIRRDIEKNALILILEYKNRLFRDALRLCRNNVFDAEDLVSVTMASAIKSLQDYEDMGDLYGWLKTILLRRHADQMRKPVAAGTVPVDPTVFESDESLAVSATEEAILRNSDSEALRVALERLDPKYKQTVLLHYLAEMPVKDIAMVMKVPVGTVLWRLNVARKILARDLGEKLGKKGKLALLALLFLSLSALAAWTAGVFEGEEISTEDESQQEVEMKGAKSIGVAAFAAAVTLAQPASGSVRWVDQANGNDSWNGKAEFWDGTNGPKASFTNLTSFSAGDTIYVKPGHYRISAQIDPRKNNMSFIGIGNRDEIVLDGEDQVPIFQCWDTTNYWFSGMTLVNAHGTGSGSNGYNGSAIRSYSSTYVTVSNCVFRGCVNDTVNGGAVSLMGCGATIVDCVFSNCEAKANGGALNLDGRESRILRCQFENCRAGSCGGAVSFNGKSAYGAPYAQVEFCQFVSNSAATAFGAFAGGGLFNRCTFVGNEANYGGALGVKHQDVNDSASTVYCLDCQDCTFVGNKARSNVSGRGAGVAYLYGGDASIMSNSFSRCTFVDNSATNGSGGVVWGGVWRIADCAFTNNLAAGGGALTLGLFTPEKVWSCVRSSFVDNVATNAGNTTNGGAIHGESARNGTIRNCLFVGNKAAQQGGALSLKTTHVESCTFVRNWSRKLGGAIVSGDGDVMVTNCVFKGNLSTQNGNYRDFGNDNLGTASGSCCFTDGFYWNKDYNFKFDDPLFVDYENGNLHLQKGSPCIDIGLNQDWMYTAKDLDGRKGRIANTTVDIGCYEYWPMMGLMLILR